MSQMKWEMDKAKMEMEKTKMEKEKPLERVQEMADLLQDKDQTLQQVKNDNQKQEEARQVIIHQLTTELEQEKQEHLEDSGLAEQAEREAAAERHHLEKENRALRQRVHEQKGMIREKEGRFEKLCQVGHFISPGEFARMMKSSEAKNSLALINHRMVDKLNTQECLIALRDKENELHCRHLPTHIINADREDAFQCAIARNDEQVSENDLTRPEPCQEPQ